MTKNFFKIIIFSLLFLTIFSCKKDEKTPFAESTYSKAYMKLKDHDYSAAAKDFEKIDDDFPFSKWAAKSQTMAVYAYYKNKDYADVVRVVDDFIRVNPTNEYIPYMLYMKALTYYAQIPEITRAQDNTRLAFIAFRELLARFPNSDYVDDATQKIIVINEHLAGAKMNVGRYQISQRNYVGALKSFSEVAQRFSFTNQAPEAFYRIVELYKKIGLKEESSKTYEQMKIKFPQNEWTESARKITAHE